FYKRLGASVDCVPARAFAEGVRLKSSGQNKTGAFQTGHCFVVIAVALEPVAFAADGPRQCNLKPIHKGRLRVRLNAVESEPKQLWLAFGLVFYRRCAPNAQGALVAAATTNRPLRQYERVSGLCRPLTSSWPSSLSRTVM